MRWEIAFSSVKLYQLFDVEIYISSFLGTSILIVICKLFNDVNTSHEISQ